MPRLRRRFSLYYVTTPLRFSVTPMRDSERRGVCATLLITLAISCRFAATPPSATLRLALSLIRCLCFHADMPPLDDD